MNKAHKLLVIGSVNQDIVINCEKLPSPGETIKATRMEYFSGGKGVNQAIAALSVSDRIRFIGKVGADNYAKSLLAYFQELKLDFRIEELTEDSTGLAFIHVDQQGENMISLIQGANLCFSSKDLGALDHYAEGDFLLLQNEINPEFTHQLIQLASSKGLEIIFNPAPAYRVPPEILKSCSYIIVNAHELIEVFDLELNLTREEIQSKILELSAAYQMEIVLTLGKEGVLFSLKGKLEVINAMRVEVVDTTGAGDCFVGVLSAKLLSGKSLLTSVKEANRAAAYSVGSQGANISYPRSKK